MSNAGATMLAARGRARWLATVSPAQARRDRGISGPSGPRGDAYCRVIAGLRRHLEVTW